MARYPTFDEYSKRGNYEDGVKRCDELLKRSPNDVRLLTLKLQLLGAAAAPAAQWTAILEQLTAIQPPLRDPTELATIEDAVDTAQQDVYPHPLTAGPLVARLWENASKSPAITTPARLDLLSLRFSRAVAENRPLDAQQALIQLKAQQPRNRVVYMAHAAYTQLASTAPNDLQARLAHMLAKKAVSENFENEAPRLDCRVPGQIFALQSSKEDLHSIKDRPRFGESKQVYEALRAEKPHVPVKTVAVAENLDVTTVSPRTWLTAEVAELKTTFSDLLKQDADTNAYSSFAANAARLQHISSKDLNLAKHRATADVCFLAISSLIKVHSSTKDNSALLRATFLAERLLKSHEHVHEARLILVYLYMRQGLGSLAIRLFESLSVKEIQHDTIGHALFTRISLTFPYPVPLTRRETCDPYERTQRTFPIYARHEDRLAETELRVLEHAQTGMIFDLHDLREHLRDSFTRRMTALEHRRIARLTKRAPAKGSANISPRRVANWTNFLDNRDLKAAFDFGFSVEEVLFDDADASSARQWIEDVLAADCAWCLVNRETPLVIDVDCLVMHEANSDHTASSSLPSTSIAAAEIRAGSVARSCLAVLMLAKDKTAIPEDAINNLVTSVHSLPHKALVGGELDGAGVLAEGISHHYLLLDTLLLVHRTGQFVKEALGGLPDELRSLQDVAKTVVSQIAEHALARTRALKINLVRDALLQDESTREALHAYGGDAIQGFAESVLGAAKEAWSGVAKLPRI